MIELIVMIGAAPGSGGRVRGSLGAPMRALRLTSCMATLSMHDTWQVHLHHDERKRPIEYGTDTNVAVCHCSSITHERTL